MSYRDMNNPNQSTNEFDLTRDTFKLLKDMIKDYQNVKEAYTQITAMTSDTLKSSYEVEAHLKEIRTLLDKLNAQQNIIILEAKLFRSELETFHSDCKRMLNLLGDISTLP